MGCIAAFMGPLKNGCDSATPLKGNQLGSLWRAENSLVTFAGVISLTFSVAVWHIYISTSYFVLERPGGSTISTT